MHAVIRSPLLHFFLLAAVLYVVLSQRETELLRTVHYPETGLIDAALNQLQQFSRRPATDKDRRHIVRQELDRRILFNEALQLDLHRRDSVVRQRLLRNMRFLNLSQEASEAEQIQTALDMQLHLNDEVIKRRLIQVVESVLRAPGEARIPDEQALAALYQQRQSEFVDAEKVALSHVFVSSDRHGFGTAERAANLLKTLRSQSMSVQTAQKLSEPFLSGLSFALQSEDKLVRYFGSRFAKKAFSCPSQKWCGPIESPYGWHLVWLHAREASRQKPLSEVKEKLIYHWRRERGNEALQQGLQTLRLDYEVLDSPVDFSWQAEAPR